MSTLFYHNRRLLLLAIGLILVAGTSSIMVMPRMEDPVLKERAANINTFFPGAEAERVESLVTEKIEDELLEIEEIKEIRSMSRVGISTIAVELRDDIYDVDPVWSRIRDRLGDVTPELPEGAREPEFEQLEVKAFAAIVALKWESDEAPNYAILRRLSEDLEERLRAVRGTEQVTLFGDPVEQITVRFDAQELSALGLTAAEVARQIESSDAKISAGQLRGDRYDLVVAIDEELDSMARISKTPIQLSEDGQFTRLSDVSEIEKGIADPPGSLAFIDGKPAIALGLFVRPEYRIDIWNAKLSESLAEFDAELPTGVSSSVIFEQNTYVSDRLQKLVQNLFLGAAAVVLVILLMMGWRSALVVGAALPLASLMVIGGLRWMEIPIHQMSVTGLIIALGLLIDNAIVIVDEVVQGLRKGLSAPTAIAESVRHLAIPLFGSTLTTALAFAPIALMPGPAGEFVSSIAISVILAIFASLVLALTITPTLAALVQERRFHSVQMSHIARQIGRVTRRDSRGASRRSSRQAEGQSSRGGVLRSIWHDGFQYEPLSQIYRRTLDGIFARPWLGVLLGIVLPVAGFIAATQLPEQFFPPADRDQIQVELELPPEASLTQTREMAMKVRDALLDSERVERVHWFLGESAPTFYYNVIPRRKGTSRYAQAMVKLDSSESLRPLIHQLQDEMDQSFPGARILVRQLEQGPPFDAPIEVRLFGPDLDRLQSLGAEVHEILANTPQIIHSRSEVAERVPKLAFSIDEEEARLANLDHSAIARQLEGILEGSQGGTVLESTEEIPVRVRVTDDTRSDLSRIESLDLLGTNQSDSPTREQKYSGVPFSALADVTIRPEVAAIQHFNGRRLNEFQAFIPAGVLPSNVLSDFQSRLAEQDLALPAGYEIEYGGEAAKRDDAVGNLMANVGILAVLMVATLVLSFGSFRLAGLIASVAFLAVGLGTGALWLFGYPFGFMAIVGTMGLIGVAINDSIVVLAALQANPDARAGDRIAVRQVVERATRHVLSTSLTTMAGFTPLVLSGGGFWPPLAVSIAGGVIGATILALYFVPAAFLIMMCPRCPLGRDRREGNASDNQPSQHAAQRTSKKGKRGRTKAGSPQESPVAAGIGND